MNIIESENCLFCRNVVETIEHVYLTCPNSTKLWHDTIVWVRNIYDQHFMISDQESFFGSIQKNQIANLIISSVKDVIYQKRKEGKEMLIVDVKRCLLKNLNVVKAREILSGSLEVFENKWNSFIQDWVSSGRNLFLPGQRKKHGFFRIFPLSSGRNGRMGSMIRIEKAMGYE